jgi:replicative DNA helicase
MTDKDDLIQNIERIISNSKLSERDVLQQIKTLCDTQMRALYPSNAVSFLELLPNWIKTYHAASENENVISSGFTDLDKLTGGFSKEEVVVIGGRPGMGKTLLLINLALHISKTLPVLFLTYELSEQSLVNRFLSSVSDIESWKIARKFLTPQEQYQLDTALKSFDKHQLFINYHPQTDIDALKAHCIQQIEEQHIKVIMIDTVQSLDSGRSHSRSRDSEMSYICKELKKLAREYHICVIATSSLNRGVENRHGSEKRPQLSDLRESGAIEEVADKVFLLFRPEYYRITEDESGRNLTGITEVIVEKNNGGALGSAFLKRTEGFSNFVDLHIPTSLDEVVFPPNRLDEIDNTSPF